MGNLYQSDCRALLAAVASIHSIQSLKQFHAGVFSALKSVFSCDSMCYNEIVLPDTMRSWMTDPAEAFPGPILKDAFLRHYQEHPVFLHYSQSHDLNSYRMSDFVSQRRFHDLVLYNEYYRQSGVEYQLATSFLPNREAMIGITLDRSLKDFTESERLSLDLLRPHLALAYRNARTIELMRAAVEGDGKGILIVSRSGQVKLESDNVCRVMARYFHMPPWQKRLPDALKSWIRQERDRLEDECEAPVPPSPMVINMDGHRLMAHFLWGGKFSGQDMVLLEEETAGPGDERDGDATLTSREKEVMGLLAQGKSNREIGQSLSISALTVKKHLENVYRKLQVHGRGAAVAHLYHL
jgi:DNA-binding CsgD family transcriptional regulator